MTDWGTPGTGQSLTHATAGYLDMLQVWSNSVIREAESRLELKQFMGEGPNNIITVDHTFEDQKGKTKTFNIGSEAQFNDYGPTGGKINAATLKGYEEAPYFDKFDISLFLMRAAHRPDRWSMQLSNVNFWEEGWNFLVGWLTNSLNIMMFNTLAGVSSGGYSFIVNSVNVITAVANSEIVYGGGVADENSLTESNIFTMDDIEYCVEIAKTGKTSSTQAFKRNPIMIDGSPGYVMYLHPWNVTSLRNDTRWESAQQNAAMRGKDNPLFSGVLGYWDGVLLKESRFIPIATNTANVSYSTSLFLSAQAGVLASCQDGKSFTDVDDYGMLRGVDIEWLGGFGRVNGTLKRGGSEYANKDFGVIAVKTAAKAGV